MDSRARYQFKKSKLEKDDTSFCKIGLGSKITNNVINLDDYSSDIDQNSATKNIKKKKRSMTHTPTNAIIDIEDNLDDPSNLDFQISRHQFVMQFPRPEYMNLNDDHIDVAYYIFSRGLQTDEVLVKNNNYFCDRGSLWTLLP
ncbi:hypothetical protein LINPERPRIM_LOCUS5475 [Linum perenne]